MSERRVVSPDADIESADWTKKSWDLPPYKSQEFNQQISDLDSFRTLPVYSHAVCAGRILDDEWVADYPIKVAVHSKSSQKDTDTFSQVQRLARDFLQELSRSEVQAAIEKAHKHGESSTGIEGAIESAVRDLGFESQKKNLFSNLQVPALRGPSSFRVESNSQNCWS